ncbi:MAG: DUF4124 domain-containing protein [Pseudomonadota bacterium]|nr:DUF4124 domain-containing protein [Pseudomonadota bacterium]
MEVQATGILLALLFPLAAHAGTYKCTQPDGSVTFQQTQCAGSAAQNELDIDTGPPADRAGSRPSDYYSIENQIRRRESERSRLKRDAAEARLKDAQASMIEKERELDDHDDITAKCDVYRGMAAQAKRMADTLKFGSEGKQWQAKHDKWMGKLKKYCIAE